MIACHVPAFDATVQKSHEWLRDLVLLGEYRDQEQAYGELRAVLHALRDRLMPDEAVNLGAQLPMLIRGMYYEGWKPSATPTHERTPRDFLLHVRDKFAPSWLAEPGRATVAAFRLLNLRVSEGELDDVRHMLPADIRRLWPDD